MEEQDKKPMVGQIKWFDPGKGFGFIVTDPDGPDVLLHANVLRNFGQGSVAEGASVEVIVQATDRGLQAVEVLKITPPAVEESVPLGDMEDVSLKELAEKPVLPARVKWFDKSKGFGFANVFGDSRDVFVHIEVLRRSGLADLTTGEAIGLKMMDGKRGLMAVEIVAWDANDG